ncbi:hypothetical protein LDENG_00209890, partial [Lucifuga dentata]
ISASVNDFNLKITNFIDDIAPVRVKTISGKIKAPWRNATLVKLQKTVCRKVERRWRKAKLEVHYDIYKERLHIYNIELKRASRSFFTEIINKNKNNAVLC